MILALSDHKLVRKGCEAYLAYVLDSNVEESKIDQVPVVKYYTDVFPEDLPGLPPPWEVEFMIELMFGTAPISITSYRMASAKLKELKTPL